MVINNNVISIESDIRKIIGSVLISELGKTIEELGILNISKKHNGMLQVDVDFPSHALKSY